MNTSFTLTCDEFKPEVEDLTYSMSYEIKDSSKPDDRMFLTEVTSSDGEVEISFKLPAGKIKVNLQVCNPYGACIPADIEGNEVTLMADGFYIEDLV